MTRQLVRTLFVATALAVAAALACSAKRESDRASSNGIEGRWAGVATFRGAKAPLTLDLKKRGDTLLASVTMNVEAFYVDRPLVNVRYDHPAVHFEFYDFRGSGGVFDGIRRGDTITGVTRKNANAVAMRFERVARQTPSPPYDRKVREFSSRDGTRLEGTLFIRPARSAAPAVVLIHGSGPSIREDLFYLADRFARAGVAAFAYDKRGSGKSGGEGRRTALASLADDSRAALETVRKLPGIDPQRIGLVGLSEGGWVAPIVAAGNPHVGFVVTIVAPGATYASNALYQNELRIRNTGAPESAITRYRELGTRVNEYVRRLKQGTTPGASSAERVGLQAALDSARRESWARVADLPARLPSPADLSLFRWRTMDFDPRPFWKRVTAPVLLVFAENDRNVNTAEARKSIAEAIAAGGNTSVSEIVYPGVEHELMVQPRSAAAFHFPYPAPGYPDSIVAWVSRVTSGQAVVR